MYEVKIIFDKWLFNFSTSGLSISFFENLSWYSDNMLKRKVIYILYTCYHTNKLT